MDRRTFIGTTATLAAAATAARAEELHVATNTYPWGTFAQRRGGNIALHSDALLGDIAATGIRGYEPIINSPAEFDGLAARLEKHGLDMRSLYVNSVLHDPVQTQDSVAQVLAIARPAAEMGVKIIVTNPSPIRWGGPENKSDAQLMHQAKALNDLGAALRELGIALAYHNHDIELRCGAREFHHMLTATDPENVRFCLDAHWVFRGCEDSEVALFDAVEHYGECIVELHLRQSKGGPWTEVFTAGGDIDYARLADWLRKHNIKPHLVLEQAVEGDSPDTLDAIAAHRQGLAQVQDVFGSA